MGYNPPYTITSKMLSLSTQIGVELTKIEANEKNIITPKLRKKNRIKTLAGTLEIEGNFLGEEKITTILETIKSSVKDSVKSSVNTEDRILEYLKQNPKITIKELAQILDLTTRAIEKQIAKLKKENKILRVGSARKGYWEIVDE